MSSRRNSELMEARAFFPWGADLESRGQESQVSCAWVSARAGSGDVRDVSQVRSRRWKFFQFAIAEKECRWIHARKD